MNRRTLCIAFCAALLCAGAWMLWREGSSPSSRLSLASAPGQARQAPAAAKATDEIALAVLDAIHHMPDALGLEDLAGLQRIAPEAVRAMSSGDGAALHSLVRDRGAALNSNRIPGLRAELARIPEGRRPPSLDTLTDDEIASVSNNRAVPYRSLMRSSLAAFRVGETSPLEAADTFFKPTATSTPNRLAFRGEPWTMTNLVYTSPLALAEPERRRDTVVVEFSGVTDRGEVLTGIAFSYFPDTGWIPTCVMNAGARHFIPL
jgi:hypothetical protein